MYARETKANSRMNQRPLDLIEGKDDLLVYKLDTNEDIRLYIDQKNERVKRMNVVEKLFVRIQSYCDTYSSILFNDLSISALYEFLFSSSFHDDLEPELNMV